jgi:hypothetical protein
MVEGTKESASGIRMTDVPENSVIVRLALFTLEKSSCPTLPLSHKNAEKHVFENQSYPGTR